MTVTASLYRNAIGQLPILNTYNHGTLGFEIVDDRHEQNVIDAMKEATQIMVNSFPWLGGAVVNEGSNAAGSGIYRSVPWPATAMSPNPLPRIKDCRDTLPSFDELVKSGAPVSKLTAAEISEYPGFPVSVKSSPEHPAPVIAIQANFVRGGLLLNFSAHHNVIDASGMMQVIHLFSKALKKEPYTTREIEQGNRDPASVVEIIAPGEPVKDHSHLQRPADFVMPKPPAAADLPKWAYFLLDGTTVSTIKERASDITEFDTDVKFISTNDALSALYWKCLAEVRMQNGRSPEAVSKFSRAIDCRRAVNVPHEYMGHMVYHAAARMTLKDVSESSLSAIASKLRQALNAANTEWSVRSYVSFIDQALDKSQVLYGGLYNPDTDIGSSSVPNADFFHSFGILGVPQFARRPNLAPIPGCLYFMPPEGRQVPVLVCLRDDDLAGLRENQEWSRITKFIG